MRYSPASSLQNLAQRYPPPRHSKPPHKLGKFADDTKVSSTFMGVLTGARRVQFDASLSENFLKTWQINVNPSRSVACVSHADSPNGHQTSTYPYKRSLGITLVSSLTWEKHITDSLISAKQNLITPLPYAMQKE